MPIIIGLHKCVCGYPPVANSKIVHAHAHVHDTNSRGQDTFALSHANEAMEHRWMEYRLVFLHLQNGRHGVQLVDLFSRTVLKMRFFTMLGSRHGAAASEQRFAVSWCGSNMHHTVQFRHVAMLRGACSDMFYGTYSDMFKHVQACRAVHFVLFRLRGRCCDFSRPKSSHYYYQANGRRVCRFVDSNPDVLVPFSVRVCVCNLLYIQERGHCCFYSFACCGCFILWGARGEGWGTYPLLPCSWILARIAWRASFRSPSSHFMLCHSQCLAQRGRTLTPTYSSHFVLQVCHSQCLAYLWNQPVHSDTCMYKTNTTTRPL